MTIKTRCTYQCGHRTALRDVRPEDLAEFTETIAHKPCHECKRTASADTPKLFHLTSVQAEWLAEESAARGISQAAIVREAIDKQRKWWEDKVR